MSDLRFTLMLSSLLNFCRLESLFMVACLLKSLSHPLWFRNPVHMSTTRKELTLLISHVPRLRKTWQWAVSRVYNMKSYKGEFLFPVSAISNYHKLSSCKQHEFILPQFWGPNQGIKRATLPLAALGEDLFLVFSGCWWLLVFFWLVASSVQSLPLSSHCLLFCMCIFFSADGVKAPAASFL